MGIKPLDYKDAISLAEANTRIGDLREAFQQINEKYSRKKSIFGKKITNDDQHETCEMVGVILPLCMQPSVQEELKDASTSENTVWHKANCLLQEILLFLSDFKNSGVQRVN